MHVCDIRDTEPDYKKRLVLYKENNVLSFAGKPDGKGPTRAVVILGFDDISFEGWGYTKKLALEDAERRWKKYNKGSGQRYLDQYALECSKAKNVCNVRDKEPDYQKRIALYRASHIFGWVTKQDDDFSLRLGFDWIGFTGVASTEELALVHAEKQWRQYDKENPKNKAFTRCA